MRKLLTMTMATAVAVSMVAATGYAQRGGGPAGDGPPRAAGPGAPSGPRPERPGRGGQRGRLGGPAGPFAGLNLTEEQRTQVRDIMLKSRDEAGPLADQLQLARKDLRREIFADKRDNGRLRDLSGKVESLQKQVSEVRLKARTAMANVLTPEQRQQMRAMPRASIGAGPRGKRSGPGRQVG